MQAWVGAGQGYLLAEEAVHQEDEDTLQAVDDGEEVGHDGGHGAHLQDAQTPGAAQDEEMSHRFECQHPRLEGNGGSLCTHNKTRLFSSPPMDGSTLPCK